MKKLFLVSTVILLLASCDTDGNTGNPPADKPSLNKETDHDTANSSERDTSIYPR